MTKYCPNCESEFQDNLSKCPQDGAELQNTPKKGSQNQVFADIYAAANQAEADLILGMLKDKNIACKLLTDKIAQYPTLGDTHFVVAVIDNQRENALKAIEEAKNDGVISHNGVLL